MSLPSPAAALEQRRQQRARRRSTIPAALRDLQQALGAPRELRALGQLRRHQWQRDIEWRIDQAIRSAPEEPGPLNPRMLAVRSLIALGERSPAYLRHFVAYLDTLVWLEGQARPGQGRPGQSRPGQSRPGQEKSPQGDGPTTTSR